MSAPDVRMVRYTGEYGAMEGFLRRETPRPLDHNFHVREEIQGQVAGHWGFAMRPKYRLMELPLNLVNIGDAPMELGSRAENPSYYRPIIGGASWMMGVRELFSYKFDDAAEQSLLAIMIWNAFEVVSGHPKVESAPTNIKLSPGWAAVVVEYAFAPIDITDVADGNHLFSVMISPPGQQGHVLDFPITLDKMDLRIAPS